jgi:hypothetical protein
MAKAIKPGSGVVFTILYVPHLLLLFSSPAQNGLDATNEKEYKVFFM